MILYFSGTGNSAYIAHKIATSIQEPVFSINDKIKSGDYGPLYSDTPFVIISPTYAWRIPHIVEDYIFKTQFKGNQKIYFLMTCGGDIGNARKSLQKLCMKKNLEFQGVQSFLMPDNYIALYDTPNVSDAREMLQRIEPEIQDIIELIKKQEGFSKPSISLLDRTKSSFMNPLFYSAMVHSTKFWTQENCIGCSVCVKECPLNNIQLQNARPVWGNSCTHCMACISKCPVKAIEYGKHTKNRNRYICP